MKVKAAPGVRVPMDGAPRKYITDAKEVTVDATPYYLLRLKDGDLTRTDLPPTTNNATVPSVPIVNGATASGVSTTARAASVPAALTPAVVSE